MLSACVTSISCMRFLYSIFLVIASLFAEGWERPSVSGTHLSVTIVQVCLVSCVWPYPATATTSISLCFTGGPPHLPSRCPPGSFPMEQPLPAATTSWE